MASFGGGIETSGRQTTITFCTVYGNKTTGNGGGLFIEEGYDANGNYTPGQVNMSRSIVVGNNALMNPNVAGTLITGGYNLIQGFVGVGIRDPNGLHNTDKEVKLLSDIKIDSHLSNNDKKTQMLSNGGHTQTLKLLRGSPAIDAIPPDACHVTIQDASGQDRTITTDQLDDPRPDKSAGKCDIGAYELSY